MHRVVGIMSDGRLARLRQTIFRVFPERHVYLRSGGDIRSFVLTTADQVIVAAALTACLTWTLFATGSMALGAFSASSQDAIAAKTQAYYERLIADRQARLNSAVAFISSSRGNMDGLARAVTERHAALAMLLSDLHGAPGALAALAPIKPEALQGKSPSDQIQSVESDQERLVTAAEGYAHSRADRLRLAFHLAGLDPSSYSGRASAGDGLGGPLIETKDPRALAAVLDVDEDFASRIQHAALDLNALRSMSAEVKKLPLAEPLSDPRRSSPFGVRIDPFTHRGAFHPGQDFAGGFMTPIHATAPGVVSFTGQRNGYGNVVEIDHGGGFKTRYAHLQAISVATGQRVGLGDRIGGMGSTGRSTGVHLHYEVWQNGRVQDPTRFLKAGDYVQQNND
jgi:murein DD-endopeptidase MepM/ murein hydrolase activator NlpD